MLSGICAKNQACFIHKVLRYEKSVIPEDTNFSVVHSEQWAIFEDDRILIGCIVLVSAV